MYVRMYAWLPFPVLMELHGSVIQHIHRVALKANVGLLIP